VSGLSDLRDVQVQISTIRKISKDFPELRKFYKRLQNDEQTYLKRSKQVTAPAFVNPLASAIGRIKVSLNTRRATLAPDRAQNIVAETINKSFDLVAKRLKELNPGEYSTIHRVRLAFKPFRYLLETFYPLLPEVDLNQVKKTLWLARVMGEIQDCDVLMKNLVEYKWENGDQRKAMLEIWQETETRKNEATRRFLGSLDKFSELLKPISHDQVRPIRMKTIYILRHAIAVQRGDPAYPLDSDRPLTPKGVRRMRRIANGMRRLGVKFDLILTSPYRRALETAFIVARQFRAGEVIQTTSLLAPEIQPEDVVNELASKYGACRNVILVGHEPQLSAIVSRLLYGNLGSPPLLKKGGLCKLQVIRLGSEKAATLSWLLTPKQLVAMA
jgi:phosphohistidine phosphatase